MTSVKDFRRREEPTPSDLGRGAFVFTDDYSIFDWGKMPDEIPQKGKALCTMGAYNFELLESEGIPTHYQGVRVDGEVQSLDDALATGGPPREMAIDLTQVPDLPFDSGTYDYETYHENAGENYLIPLEIVFRDTVPVGSSLRKRTDPGDHGLSFTSWPDGTVKLPEPVIEFSTKYEKQDRYLTREEAENIAGRASIDRLEAIALEVDDLLTRQADRAGFVHEDGKIECLYHQGEIRVADVVGTFDENRYAYEDQELSKEVLRQYHKRTQPAWVEAVAEAKERAVSADIADWKSLVEAEPEPLSPDVIETARDLYCAGTNTYIGRGVFEAPPLADVIETIHQVME